MEENKITQSKSNDNKILAILSIVFSGIPFLGIILGIISLLIEKTKSSKIMAIIGIALNIIIPILLTIALVVGGVFAYYNYQRDWNRMNDQFYSEMAENDQEKIIDLIQEHYHPSAYVEYKDGVLYINQFDESTSGNEIMRNVLIGLNETYDDLLSIKGVDKLIVESELDNEMYVSLELTDKQAEGLDKDLIDELMFSEDYYSVLDHFDFYTGIYSY